MSATLREINRLSISYTLLVFALLAFIVGISDAAAGTVTVRKSSDPFDAFAVRDELAKDHKWQQALAQQQQLDILRSLPAGCLSLMTPYPYYSCAALFYRPHQHQGELLYIQIPDPAVSSN
ncbi:hypothetical protein [Shewanella sp.]|uniref:hypothetical protein n=1 Tax=Shewanella sp. TaxID=50422 RepID=UPI0040549722